MNKNTQIVPAVLEMDWQEILRKLELVRAAGIRAVQIDICDGRFVPSRTFGGDGLARDFAQIGEVTAELELELDMMVEVCTPEDCAKWLTAINIAKAGRVVWHAMAVQADLWSEIFAQNENCGPVGGQIENDASVDVGGDMPVPGAGNVKIGLGVSLDDDFAQIEKLLRDYEFDFVQVMGIARVGFGGQKFDSRALDIIAQIAEKYPNLKISVDGGIKLDNALKLTHAGATRLVAGSALFAQNDLAMVVEEFKFL